MFCLFFFFFNDTATTEIYTLSLHDALPILNERVGADAMAAYFERIFFHNPWVDADLPSLVRSEEHTSELQSRLHLVCRLLLEKKKIHILDACLSHVIIRITSIVT